MGKITKGSLQGGEEMPLVSTMSPDAEDFPEAQKEKRMNEKEQHGFLRAGRPLDELSVLLTEHLKEGHFVPPGTTSLHPLRFTAWTPERSRPSQQSPTWSQTSRDTHPLEVAPLAHQP